MQFEATFNATLDAEVALNEAAEFHAPFYSNSLFYPSDQLLTNASTLSFTRYTYNGTSSDVSWYVLWDIFGGKKSAISVVPQDATAYNARDMFMNLQARVLTVYLHIYDTHESGCLCCRSSDTVRPCRILATVSRSSLASSSPSLTLYVFLLQYPTSFTDTDLLCRCRMAVSWVTRITSIRSWAGTRPTPGTTLHTLRSCRGS